MSKAENFVLPFVDVDIREIFEIAIKAGFKSQKKRKEFWRRQQSYQKSKEKEQECQEEVLTEQAMMCLPKGNPTDQSSWSQDESPLTKAMQDQNHHDGLKVLKHQDHPQKEGIPQEMEARMQQYQGQKVRIQDRVELGQQPYEGERDEKRRELCCLQDQVLTKVLRGHQKIYSKVYFIQQQGQGEADITMNEQENPNQQEKKVEGYPVLPDLCNAKEGSAKEAEIAKCPIQDTPRVTEKGNQLNQIEVKLTQEESHHPGQSDIESEQIELCQESRLPENPHDSERLNETEPQVYDQDDLKTKQQKQVEGQSREPFSFLEKEVVKVMRLWQQWEINEVVKVMQEHHCSQVEEMQKVILQQWTEEEGSRGAKLQCGSRKKLGSLMQPQGRQIHEHSWGNWGQCQKKEEIIPLLPQQDGELSEVLSTETQLGREDKETMQQQNPNKEWPIQENEASELSQKESQVDEEPKVFQLEQQEENITGLTGISQILQVLKQQHQCQKEAILKVMRQQQTHQEEAIQKALGEQCQVQEVLKAMRQEWQSQMEAILETMELQEQFQAKAILKVMRQLGHQWKEDSRMIESDQDHHEKEMIKHGSKCQSTKELQDQREVDLKDPSDQHDNGAKEREQDQDQNLDRESITFKERTSQRGRLKHTQNNISKKTGQQIQNKADQRQELGEEENDNKVAEQNQEEEKKSKKHKRDSPNYFVAIPITNDQILDKIEDVQEFIYSKEPELLKALIPVQTMHITIIVAHLRTKQDVQKAISALEESKVRVEELLEGRRLNMTFHGIGQFSNQVIYVKMSGEQEQQLLSKIAEAVERSFQEMNIDITGSKDFRPHLTFLKLSKAPALRRKGFRKIHSELYKEYEDYPFGTEIFSQIDLCSMHKKKQESGYYHCECTISVAPGSTGETQKLPTEIEYLKELCVPISPDPCPEAKAEETKATECCRCISCIAEDDDKPTEYTSSIRPGCETVDQKTGVSVLDEIFTIDAKVFL
uniref:Putative leucine-rich repeat-containing protein DDB_G0290503 n=1 Tax=Monodelphis domestica TaxID=13616 RepID=K7E4C4_MONDO